MYNSIFEQRRRIEEGFHMELVIPQEDYEVIYGKTLDESTVKNLVDRYLQYRDDDGDPKNISFHKDEVSKLIEIEADLTYLGNKHKDYE